jgi:hypothetical protein
VIGAVAAAALWLAIAAAAVEPVWLIVAASDPAATAIAQNASGKLKLRPKKVSLPRVAGPGTP